MNVFVLACAANLSFGNPTGAQFVACILTLRGVAPRDSELSLVWMPICIGFLCLTSGIIFPSVNFFSMTGSIGGTYAEGNKVSCFQGNI